jgi:phospholipid transport system transporter-binding protein
VSGVELAAAGEGRWRLAGELDFASVAEVWPRLDAQLTRGGRVTLSLDGVSRSNSAGLVLLVEALDVARQRGCRLAFADIPAGLLDLARMSRCDALLGDAAA